MARGTRCCRAGWLHHVRPLAASCLPCWLQCSHGVPALLALPSMREVLLPEVRFSERSLALLQQVPTLRQSLGEIRMVVVHAAYCLEPNKPLQVTRETRAPEGPR